MTIIALNMTSQLPQFHNVNKSALCVALLTDVQQWHTKLFSSFYMPFTSTRKATEETNNLQGYGVPYIQFLP
jgi:hypothetical protein